MAKIDVSVETGDEPAPPPKHPNTCPSCHSHYRDDELEAAVWVCRQCGHHFPMRARSRIEYLADEICLAWLLERRLYDAGWETVWEGEITGLINSGLFCRFGTVFEGFLPARRLHGEFFELNGPGTKLAGRTTGRSYRLGDPIEVRVHSISRSEGKVDLDLA